MSSYHHGLNWKAEQETLFKIEWQNPNDKDFSENYSNENNKLLQNTKLLIERRINALKKK